MATHSKTSASTPVSHGHPNTYQSLTKNTFHYNQPARYLSHDPSGGRDTVHTPRKSNTIHSLSSEHLMVVQPVTSLPPLPDPFPTLFSSFFGSLAAGRIAWFPGSSVFFPYTSNRSIPVEVASHNRRLHYLCIFNKLPAERRPDPTALL